MSRGKRKIPADDKDVNARLRRYRRLMRERGVSLDEDPDQDPDSPGPDTPATKPVRQSHGSPAPAGNGGNLIVEQGSSRYVERHVGCVSTSGWRADPGLIPRLLLIQLAVDGTERRGGSSARQPRAPGFPFYYRDRERQHPPLGQGPPPVPVARPDILTDGRVAVLAVLVLLFVLPRPLLSYL